MRKCSFYFFFLQNDSYFWCNLKKKGGGGGVGGFPDVLMAKYQKRHKCSDCESFAAAAVTHQDLMSHGSKRQKKEANDEHFVRSERSSGNTAGWIIKKKKNKN